MVHYADNAKLMTGIPSQISQYNIGEGKKDDKTEKHSFTMRVSNNIHNVACLDEVEFIQEWTEQEKIPIKASPITTATPPKQTEDKKEEEKKTPKTKTEAKTETKTPEKPEEAAKPAVVTQPEQSFEIKEKKKKNFSQISFTSQSFALAPNQRKEFQEVEN